MIQEVIRSRQFVLIVASVMFLATAIVIVGKAGLPTRAEYTGRVVAGELAVAPEINALAPPFELNDISGQRVNFNALQGKPVVINFWATWCEPCKVEMPALQSIYDVYQVQGLRILAVNLDETNRVVSEWVTAMRLSFDILLDTDLHVSTVYQLRGQPSTYVVSPEGIITQIFYGPVDVHALQNAIAPYFPN